ncbi:hypothetical protein MN116_009016 [Schistosoma mekongi]|uniref:Uncharacterized protein n=1 Tax=Schistosoma mekongi TaxID=38744 RepID=A0AAE2D1W7_SCHME|nr:hypothetical protein MN116_009016 [Schistosoma mekongi]
MFTYSFQTVKAYLAETVYNTTVDWGAIYRFPCIFGGTDPRVDTMILNNKVVTEMEHNITEDSVVECKVQNSLGMVHDFAYIKVRPDSEAWGIKHGVSIRKHCLAVTGLFCFSSLKVSNNSALDGLLDLILHNESLIASHFVKTGWSELISVPEARSQNLPLSFSHPLINGTSHPFYVCSSINSYAVSSDPSTKSLCT